MDDSRRASATGRAEVWAIWGPALVALVLALPFATRYGIFRDELYYLACAQRLAWGYVDHPPLVAALAAAWTALAGDSLFALRLLPALATAATVALAGSLARAFGGGRFAVWLAGLATALAPIVLALGSTLSMNAFDLLFWALAFRLLVALLAGADERLWLAFGAVCGVGLLNKVSVLFLGFGLVAGLVAARRWDIPRTPWFWAGGGLAALLFMPHLLWQAAHGWPTLEFIDNARRLKNLDFSPLDFVLEQIGQTGPVIALAWIAGLGALLAARRFRPYRALGWTYLAVLAVMLSTQAKPYYLAPAYSVLWAAGAVAIEGFTSARRAGAALRAAALVLVVASGLLLAPLARPMLSVERYLVYAAALGEAPGTDERHEVGRLPQFFADMQEWRELAVAVGRAAARLAPGERERACVFGQNYGEAGAVERFGAELSLPPAISAHNSWFLWGPGSCTGDVLLVLGDHRERLLELFGEVELGATFDCRDCMPYEDELPIWIARRPRQPLAPLWPAIKSYI
jgi:hypothetical protein